MTNEPCVLCGAPMPSGEETFQYHGFSGPCPKPILKSCPRTMFGHNCRGKDDGLHNVHEIQFKADNGRQIVVTWREVS